MSTQIDICNRALDRIGEKNISAITDDSPSARRCLNWYDQSRLDTLEAHTWKPASKQAQLPKSPTPPLFGYANRYELPSDFLRMIAFGYNRAFTIKEQFILTDAGDDDTGLNIEYVFDLVDVSKFSAKMVGATTYYLAANIATAMTKSPQLVAELTALAQFQVNEAINIDSMDRSSTRIRPGSWHQARFNRLLRFDLATVQD